jgi:hypothetical protein
MRAERWRRKLQDESDRLVRIELIHDFGIPAHRIGNGPSAAAGRPSTHD